MGRLQVQDLMTAEVVAVREADTLATARELMDEHHVRHLPVVDADENLIGLLSHLDLVRSALSDRSDLPLSVQNDVLGGMRVRDVMTVNVESASATDDLASAAQLMLDNKYGCLPVVEGSRLVGILTEADFVKYVAEQT